MAGRQFGRWTVVRRDALRNWLCKCSCGTEKSVDGATLRNGHSTSCGCLRTEQVVARATTHGMARLARVTPEWITWSSMRGRCSNRKSRDWKNYGGRGIKVCDRWLNSFANFFADMGPRPTPKHSIDRIDNDGPYSPDNCRWVTRTKQSRNRRSNRNISFNGKTRTLAEWGERAGIDPETISFRLKSGWTIERALNTKSR